jgi:hypothetical protein
MIHIYLLLRDQKFSRIFPLINVHEKSQSSKELITRSNALRTLSQQGETRFSNKVKKSVQNLKYTTKTTLSNALHTLSQHRVTHCIDTESIHSYARHTLSQHRVMHCTH